MEVLDDSGRLFGVVNLVDALVLLFVLAIGIAGATLLFGPTDEPSPSSESTSYATVEYTVPISPSATIPRSGDVLEPVAGGDNFTIEDVTYSFTRASKIHSVASVSYQGSPGVGGGVAETNTEVDMRTGSATQPVRFLVINRQSPDLQTRTQSVVLALDANQSVGHTVTPGTTATINGQTVATVESVRENPVGPASRAELIGLEVRVWNDGFTNWFGSQAVRVNNRLTIITEDTVLRGQIYRIGTTDTEALVES